ncbi:MAG: response regulator [Lachnospiraceae bacterium]|nr:response regulator [Lachnospiraceae bacterium]
MLRMEMACFMVVLFMGILYFAVKHEKTKLHRVFSALLIVSMLHLGFDALTVYTVNHMDVVPVWLNDLAHRLFIGTMVTIFYLVYCYIVILIRDEIGEDIRMLKRSKCLYVFAIVCVCVLPIYYKEADQSNYAYGMAAYMTYICVAVYLLMVIRLLICYRTHIRKRELLAISAAMSIEVVVSVYQAFHPTALLSGMGIMLIILAFYLFMQNPDILLVKQVQIEKEKAEQANAYKSVFLSNISHEIRTPMNAIVGMTDILLRTELTEEQRDYLSNIKTSGHALVAIINDILDISKIEAGKMTLVEDDYDIKRELRNIQMIIENQIGEKPIRLVYDIDERLPGRLYGDCVRIRQIIINLLNNAVKFTEEGQITLSVTVAEERVTETGDAESYRLDISVSDTGQGIKEEDFAKLFEAFEQVNKKLNSGKEGTGLGLAISSQLIDMMGGKLQVESVYGEGTRFYFSIVQKPAISQEEDADDAQVNMNFTAEGAKILVVDDDLINRKVAQGLLKPFRMQIDLAEDGKKALEMIRQKEYHIVFMDHMMPVMDGVEATKILREMDDKKYEKLPVVALTANAMKEAEEIFYGAGISDVLTKPIEMERMCRVLRKWLPATLIREETADDAREEQGQAKQNPARQKEALVIEGIHVDAGIRNSGNRELFFSTMGDFYTLIDAKANKIRKCLADDMIREYTIEVHALKNSARLIGALELAEEFAKLEKAGNEENEQVLHSDTEQVLSHYEDYKRILKPYGERQQTEKREAGRDEMISCLEKIRLSVEEFDLDRTDMAMQELEEMRMPKECQNDMEQLRVYVTDVDMENIIQTADMMLAKLRKDI